MEKITDMKTISEYAKIHNISVQTVYRRIDKGVKQYDKQGLTEKHENITYITQAGEDFLYSCLTDVERNLTPVERVLNTDKPPQTVDNEEKKFMRELIEKLQNELTTEREHSRAVTSQLVEITRNNQILLKAEQDRAKPALPAANDEPPRQYKKRGFLGLFGRK